MRELWKFALIILALALCGCLVKSKCYTNDDCDFPAVCIEGKCVFECFDDDDCNDRYTVEYVCENHRCKYPVTCFECSFPNADSSCIHGVCKMEECHEGYWDLNGQSEDGCEYKCSVSGGGVESCDGLDNDCDGFVDEDFDFNSDINNCGGCGIRCPEVDHATAVCSSGLCTFVCDEGWYDNNNDPSDGCEGAECVPSEEICDGADNDCDCPGDTNADTIVCGPGDEGVDEGFDKTLPDTCGPYCVRCNYFHAEPLCIDEQCQMGNCDDGWWDVDGKDTTGCEYQCTITNDGEELCDGVDNDCDGLFDEGGVCGIECPPDMVPVGNSFCIDRYEASRPDATDEDPGILDSVATSRPNVLPWVVNPVTIDDLHRFEDACEAAGKRLCSREEWFSACTGPPPGTIYVFGNSFDPEICNCVDTFCDDYCNEHSIPPDSCDTNPNCGYTYNCFHLVPTGTFPGCTNSYGTFDMNGNVWEVVPSSSDPRGFEVRGGAFNCAGASVRLQCSFNASWTSLYAGFRCCYSPP